MSDQEQDWAEVKTKQQKRETKTKPKEEDKKKQKEGKNKNKEEKQKQKLKQSQEKNQSKKQKDEDSDEEEATTDYLASTIYSQAEKILEEKQKVKIQFRMRAEIITNKNIQKNEIDPLLILSSCTILTITQRREEASGVALPAKKKKSSGSGAKSKAAAQILPIKSKVGLNTTILARDTKLYF